MVMRDFAMISPTVWHSKRFRGPSERAKLMFFYLLCGPHGNSIGCYRLPPGYVCADMQWELHDWRSAMTELVDSGMVVEDLETDTIWIDKWQKFAGLKGEKTLKNVKKLLKALPASPAKEACQAAIFGNSDSGLYDWWQDPAPNPPEIGSIPEHLNTRYLSK